MNVVNDGIDQMNKSIYKRAEIHNRRNEILNIRILQWLMSNVLWKEVFNVNSI